MTDLERMHWLGGEYAGSWHYDPGSKLHVLEKPDKWTDGRWQAYLATFKHQDKLMDQGGGLAYYDNAD